MISNNIFPGINKNLTLGTQDVTQLTLEGQNINIGITCVLKLKLINYKNEDIDFQYFILYIYHIINIYNI